MNSSSQFEGMGWWSRTSSTEGNPTNTSGSSSGTLAPATISAASTDNRPHVPTRDEQADLELKAILHQLDVEQADIARSSQKHLTDGSDHLSTSDISPDSLYPTTMSCRQAFDMAFYCQSLGGQFQNIYRYGGLRDCSENWSQFWFCMRTKNQPEPKKAMMIQEYYKQRAAKYKIGSSSEDIWEVRKEPLIGAFMEDPDVGDRDKAEKS